MLEFHLQPGPLLPIGEPFGFGNAMAQVLLLLLQLMQVLELLPFQLPTVLEFLQAIEGLRAPLLLLDPFLQGGLLRRQQGEFHPVQLRLRLLHQGRL